MKNIKNQSNIKVIVLVLVAIMLSSQFVVFAAESTTNITYKVKDSDKAAKSDKKAEKDIAIKKEQYGEYTLGKDDVIEITVRRHPEFSGKFPINANGKIQYPFVGDIDMSDLTKTEAIKHITKILTEFIESPEVDITILQYNSKVVYVVGQVARPGKYPMRAEFMPVREAVLAAGLPRENIASLRRAVIIRPIEGKKALVKKVNMLSLLYEGNLKLNYDLQAGDIVYLPSTVLWKVSAVLRQVLDPAFQATSIYDTVDDIHNNNN